ncbi:O-antigen ligase [Arenibacter nanhaiticus]|uniref:O-antigen ligase n=1 Tax=Arenibacter nanhaiticus TaxID=558155 RepID=A0A1M6A2E5_9FLAO|nr:O-antigen ligase family protein [Arenibacter nanhaiticus]SHI30681.1 O-antigen ligase [Arenibacter nanhaiticus]
MSDFRTINFKNLLKSNSVLENINYGKILLYSFAVSIYLPMIFTNIISIILVVYCFFKFNKVGLKTVIKDKFVTLFLLFFLILAFGFLYNIPVVGVFKGMEKKLSFLVLPITIGLIGIKRKDIEIIFMLFFYAGILVTTFAFFKVFLSPLEPLEFKNFINHELSNKVGLHATYLSMFLVLSLAYPLLYLKSLKNNNIKISIYCLSIVCVVYILFLGVRIVWLTLVLLLILSGFYLIRKSVFSKKNIFIASITVIIIPLLIFMVNPLRERLKEMVNYNNEYNTKEVWGGRGIRIMIWESGFQLFKKQPLLGYGSSNAVQTELETVYKENNLGPLLYMMEKNGKTFNPHNQFLSEVLKHGILIGFYYPFVLIFLGKGYYENNSIVGFLFLLITFGVSLTETILELNKGIVFFSFFASILYFSYKHNLNPKSSSRVGLE